MLATTLIIPAFLVFTKDLLTAVATDSTSSLIFQIVDFFTKQSHEQQLKDCIKKAFKQTKKQQHWKVKTRNALKAFQLSLVSFSGAFSQNSLSEMLSKAIGKEVGDDEIEQWIDNLLRQISLDEHKELRNYLLLKRILVNSSNPNTANESEQARLDYRLTYTTPVWDNKDVICRDDIIDELFAKFSNGVRRIQVAGMGGLGKTEILVKLFFQLNQSNPPVKFDYIGFIRFNDDLESDFLSQIPYLADYARNNGEEAAKLFLQQLCATKRVLFCIDDNRDNKTILKKADPSFTFIKTLNASVLFASRTEYAEFEQQDLPLLSTDACKKIFERILEREFHDPNEITMLTNIIENMSGNNTLIVNRLGNMANENNFTVEKLQKNLQDKGFHIKKDCIDEKDLQLEINKLYPLSELTRLGEISIVEAFSIFPVNPLPVDLCVEWLHEDANIDAEECSRTLTRLSKQTWLEKRIDVSNGEVFFSMHQCVKVAVKDQIEVGYSEHQHLVDRCTASLYKNIRGHQLSTSAVIIPFACELFTMFVRNVEIFFSLSMGIGEFYSEISKFDTAMEWCIRAETACEESETKMPDSYTTLYNNIAILLERKSDYDGALVQYEKARSIAEDYYGEDHIITCKIYSNIAKLYISKGWYIEAINLDMKALETYLLCFGEEDIRTSKIYIDIANAFHNLEDNKLSMKYYQIAQKICEKSLPPTDPALAQVYSGIGNLYLSMGAFEKALSFLNKALLINREIYGEESLYVGVLNQNIGMVHYHLSNIKLAHEFYCKALIVLERILGTEHAETAILYAAFARIYDSLERFDLAKVWYDKALSVFLYRLGEDHPYTKNVKQRINEISLIIGHNSGK